MFKAITSCRVCKNKHLTEVLDLGSQALSGVFPNSTEIKVPSGPLQLVKCQQNNPLTDCGLVQLKHNYDPNILYGSHYGYRSSLNTSMVKHLQQKVEKITSFLNLQRDDFILDIGSNDATTLKCYPKGTGQLIGIDPVGEHFNKYYPDHIHFIPGFFSAELIKTHYSNFQARVITSFSMFYDLENPLQFMREIKEILSDNGIWVFEQSYLPTMLKQISYDTVCHEHLEYYGLKQISWMCQQVGLKILDVEFNDVNGGSFSVIATHLNSKYYRNDNPKIQKILKKEESLQLNTNIPFQRFAKQTLTIRNELKRFLNWANSNSKTVYGLGASTKGNIILQYCDITTNEISSIGEVNQDKFGCFTPGSQIPIISESELLKIPMDYLLVLPWHFKNFFNTSDKYQKFRDKLIYPLPTLSTVKGAFSVEQTVTAAF